MSLTVRVRPCRHNRGPQPGGVKRRHLLFPVLEAGVGMRSFVSQVWAGRFPPKPLSWGVWTASPPCVPTWSSLCMSVSPSLLTRTPVTLD